MTVESRLGKKEYTDLLFGRRRFVIVKDKGLKPHDKVSCIEYEYDEPTGRETVMQIHLVDRSAEGLKEGYVAVGICGTEGVW